MLYQPLKNNEKFVLFTYYVWLAVRTDLRVYDKYICFKIYHQRFDAVLEYTYITDKYTGIVGFIDKYQVRILNYSYRYLLSVQKYIYTLVKTRKITYRKRAKSYGLSAFLIIDDMCNANVR